MPRPLAIFAAGFILLTLPDTGAAREQDDSPGAAIRTAMRTRGPIVTDADRAAIRAKCGLASDAELSSINFQDGALKCPDGRLVRDDEAAAMSKRIGERARAQAKAALADPAVRAAIARYADKRTGAALRRLREHRD